MQYKLSEEETEKRNFDVHNFNIDRFFCCLFHHRSFPEADGKRNFTMCCTSIQYHGHCDPTYGQKAFRIIFYPEKIQEHIFAINDWQEWNKKLSRGSKWNEHQRNLKITQWSWNCSSFFSLRISDLKRLEIISIIIN